MTKRTKAIKGEHKCKHFGVDSRTKYKDIYCLDCKKRTGGTFHN